MSSRLASIAALFLLAVPTAAIAADSPLPLELQDPRSGAAVRLDPGAKLLHVVFFAVWCPTCRAELEQLGHLQEHWEERGYRLVLIAVRTRQSAERLKRFAAENQPPGELLFDAQGKAEAGFGAQELPSHLLLDRNGAVVLRADGVDAAAETIELRLLGSGRSK